MAEGLDTQFHLPPYMQERDDNSASMRSFLSAYQEARQEQSPEYKAHVAEQQQRTQQEAALFPLKQQQAQYQLTEQALGIETQQYQREARIAGQNALTQMSGVLAEALHQDKLLDPETEAALYSIDAKAPTPAGEAFLKNFDIMKGKALDRKTRAEIAQTAAASRVAVAQIHADESTAKKTANSTNAPQFFTREGQTYMWFPGGKQATKVGDSKQKFFSDHLNAFVQRFGRKANDELEKAWDVSHPAAPESTKLPRTGFGESSTSMTDQGGLIEDSGPALMAPSNSGQIGPFKFRVVK